MLTENFIRALQLAIRAHDGQRRDFVDVPYVLHPIRVVSILRDSGFRASVLIAGLLHDVVEDSEVTLEEIINLFGNDVANLVMWVSRISTLDDGDRATRKKIDRFHYSAGPAEAQSIKLADIIDNTSNVHLRAPPEFAKKYLGEQLALINELTLGRHELSCWARRNINTGLNYLKEKS